MLHFQYCFHGALQCFQRLESLKHLTLHISLLGLRWGHVEGNLDRLHEFLQNLPQCSRTRLRTIKLITSPFAEYLGEGDAIDSTAAQYDQLCRSIEKFQVLEKLEFEWRIIDRGVQVPYRHAQAAAAKVASFIKAGMPRLDARGLLHFSTNDVWYGCSGW